MNPPDSWQVRGISSLEEQLLNRTTGGIPVGGEEGSEVISEESQGHQAADHGAAGLQDGMDHHVKQLLSFMVSYD